MKKYLEHETEATKYFARQKKTWAKQKKEEKEKELKKEMVSHHLKSKNSVLLWKNWIFKRSTEMWS